MCDCQKGKCPTCGAPVKKCPHCGKPEYDPPIVYPQPIYGPYWYPYYPPVSVPSVWINDGSDSAGSVTITYTTNAAK